MKVFITADVAGPGIHSVHAKREDAEAVAKAKAGGEGGRWSSTADHMEYEGPSGQKSRVIERPVEGNPLGE